MISRVTPFHSRGMTLVELLVALTILALLSTAITAMLRGAAQVNSAINASITTETEVELALHRLVHQVRLASSLTAPATPGTSFSLVTQPDSANNNATYAVSYALATAADGTLQLLETDPRYGTSTLLSNLQSFSVSAPTPKLLLLSLSAGQNPSITRTIKIAPRNP